MSAETKTKVGLIYEKMAAIMAEVGAVAKGRRNEKQGYQYRGVDEVYEALQPVLAKHKVFPVPKVIWERSEERVTKSGTTLIYRVLLIEYTFYAEDGSNVVSSVIGEGMDSGDKASNKAMSVAQKYALIQPFCIPTNEPKDPEIDSHEVEPKKQQEQKRETLNEYEKRGGRLQDYAPQPLPRPNPSQAGVISEPQAKRIYALARNAGWTTMEFMDLAQKEFGINSLKDMQRADYQEFCTTIETKTYQEAIAVFGDDQYRPAPTGNGHGQEEIPF